MSEAEGQVTLQQVILLRQLRKMERGVGNFVSKLRDGIAHGYSISVRQWHYVVEICSTVMKKLDRIIIPAQRGYHVSEMARSWWLLDLICSCS